MRNTNKIMALSAAGLLAVSAATFTLAGGNESAELANQADLSMQQAVEIALAEVPGKVIETELEKEDGTLVWEVEVVDAENQIHEFEIDANSGEILEREIENS